MRRTRNPAPEFRYNEAAGRYVNAQGRFVPHQTVRASLDAVLDRAAANARQLAERLRDGQISVEDWQLQMAREMKSAHLAAHALARGGWAQMSPADFGRVGGVLAREYRYLARFGEQIVSGAQRMDGTLPRRAELYIETARMTFHAAERRERQLRGVTEERNQRYAGDSCPGCLEATAAGWVPVGTLPLPGTRNCLGRCKCRLVFR